MFVQQLSPLKRHFRWIQRPFSSKLLAILLQRPTPGVIGPASWFWATRKESDDPMGAGWLAPSGDKSTYSVCDIKAKKPSNWLTSDSLSPKNLKEIHITINYTISLRCASLRKASHRRNCKEEFDVYGYQILGEANGSNLDQKKGNFSKIKTVSPSGNISNMSAIPWEVAKFSLPIKERTSSVILAIHDSGACFALNSFMVTYSVCPDMVLPDSLLVLPQTVAPTNESEIVRVSGKCVDNSKETSQGPEAICGKNGEWILADSAKEACLCNPGWQRDVAKCRECPAGSFKENLGNTRCTKCPMNSVSNADRKYCKCRQGFFRAPRETIAENCTALPSKPRHLKTLTKNQTTVVLSWSHSHHRGGRRDLFYEIECKIACQKEQKSCSQDCGSQVLFLPRQRNLSDTQATITKLFPQTSYRFTVYAKNGVSGVAEGKGFASNFAHLKVDTLESVPGKPELTVKRIDSTSVRVSWNLKNGNEGIHYFLVTYYPLEDKFDRHIKNTTESAITIDGLQPDVVYQLVVVAKNRMGYGPVSEEVNIQGKETVTVAEIQQSEDNTKLWLLTGAVVGGTLFIFFVIAIVVVIRAKRRKSDRKRANTFEAAELFSTDGLVQYVDPSNYGDPMEAVRTFAAEIEENQIKLESIIGGGEFAEVFKGFYDGSAVAVKRLKQGSSLKAMDDFISEASIMGQFKHANVIQLKGVVTTTRPMMIVTEFMEGGSLGSFLKEQKGKLTTLQLIGMIRGVASGMAYLSAINFIHRDLAARNILVGENMICKVSDFGLSRELEEDDPDSEYQTQGGKIPIRWTAPEAIRYRKFSSASDVWSFGIVVWETMSFGERPYWDWNNFQVMDRVEGGYRLPVPVKCPKIVHSVMMDCWDQDRTQRPRFEEILKRLDNLIRTPEMLHDELVCYTSAVSADFTKLNTIGEWLKSLHMEQYNANFKTAGYKDLTQVTCLKESDLKEIGVGLIGHRNKIYKSIKSMRKHFDNMPEAV
ncbi:ephrin type-B receptor 1-B-like isoform X1 [Acropora millepora]|uniref:ephrin type-B receptor 1-B-like isoform X1 n=1 Tax=Acropora millepora TaxID=45264 RepID=UPI001CF366D5|nr:ephrin type-B receptor 1-B-like isoform X1 [Acropora millepora]